MFCLGSSNRPSTKYFFLTVHYFNPFIPIAQQAWEWVGSRAGLPVSQYWMDWYLDLCRYRTCIWCKYKWMVHSSDWTQMLGTPEIHFINAGGRGKIIFLSTPPSFLTERGAGQYFLTRHKLVQRREQMTRHYYFWVQRVYYTDLFLWKCVSCTFPSK